MAAQYVCRCSHYGDVLQCCWLYRLNTALLPTKATPHCLFVTDGSSGSSRCRQQLWRQDWTGTRSWSCSDGIAHPGDALAASTADGSASWKCSVVSCGSSNCKNIEHGSLINNAFNAPVEGQNFATTRITGLTSRENISTISRDRTKGKTDGRTDRQAEVI